MRVELLIRFYRRERKKRIRKIDDHSDHRIKLAKKEKKKKERKIKRIAKTKPQVGIRKKRFYCVSYIKYSINNDSISSYECNGVVSDKWGKFSFLLICKLKLN